MRVFKVKMEAKLRLQFCAILSQLHRHKEAFEQAQEGIKLTHLIIRDKISVCRLFAKRIDFKAQEVPGSSSFFPGDDSFSQSDATGSRHKRGLKRKKSTGLEEHSKSSFPFNEEEEYGRFSYLQNNLDIDNLSDSSATIERFHTR